MSVEMLDALSGSLQLDLKAEKDAQQKRVENAGGDAFAAALAQVNAGPSVTTISGQRNNAVIPAALIDLAANDTGIIQSAEITEAPTQPTDPREVFLDFASKTPAEKMRAGVLAEMGLTEEQLRGLDSAALAEIEAKIRIRIEAKVRQEIEKQSGLKLG